MPDATRSQQPKLLDEVRNVLGLHHYSIHTERSYGEWMLPLEPGNPPNESLERDAPDAGGLKVSP